MTADNPFADYDEDDDKTVFRPSSKAPKNAPVTSPSSPPPQEPLLAGEMTEPLRAQIAQASGNPLTAAAVALLSLSSQLRHTVAHPDIAGLRNSVINELKHFETSLKQQNLGSEQIQAAHYALCTLLDEAVLNTPWGGNSLWSTQSLLITFHKEAWGGEKFFLILKNAMQQPAVHLHLLELLYFCLCLGFTGKYRVQEHGATQLEEVRENLFQLIQRQRGYSEPELSLHWQGIKDRRNVLTQFVPTWAIAALAALALMGIFLGFLYTVNQASSPLLGQLYGIKDNLTTPMTATSPTAVTPPTPAAASQLAKLQSFLAPEVQRGEVALEQLHGKTVIRIISPGLFASGSDTIVSDYYPLLNKISTALSEISTSRIVIAGHTDNVPIFSARFPSNWDLSKARAQSVLEMLSGNLQLKTPLVAEGRADSQPLVANDTAAHRAMNRRVEIIF